MINAAAPVGINGASLLTTRNAADITQAVRNARSSLMTIILLALAVSTILSLYLANTIIEPLRRLVRATSRVRLGREREVEVERIVEREVEVVSISRDSTEADLKQLFRTNALQAYSIKPPPPRQ